MTAYDAQKIISAYLEADAHRVVGPFVRKYGSFHSPRPLPRGIGRGKPRVCYANSYRLLKRHGKRLGLAYAEGYAVSGQVQVMHPQSHGWCVDREGNVYDPTWCDVRAYMGVTFKRDYLESVLSQREESGELYFGLLDDWRPGFPLIRDLGDQPEIWKHVWE